MVREKFTYQFFVKCTSTGLSFSSIAAMWSRAVSWKKTVAGTVNTTPEGIADLESMLEQLRLIANDLLVLCFFDFPIRQPNERDKRNEPV
jgi:hypothetical protein